MSQTQFWEVVGGAGQIGGILAREGEDIGSAKCASRVSHGALIEQLALHGERLNFKLVIGTGPSEGWVSTRLKEGTGWKTLVALTNRRPPSPEVPAAEPERRRAEDGQMYTLEEFLEFYSGTEAWDSAGLASADRAASETHVAPAAPVAQPASTPPPPPPPPIPHTAPTTSATRVAASEQGVAPGAPVVQPSRTSPSLATSGAPVAPVAPAPSKEAAQPGDTSLSTEDPLDAISLGQASPNEDSLEEPLAPVANDLGHFADPDASASGSGDSQSRFRIKPLTHLEVESVPKAGFIGTLAWTAPVELVHQALCRKMGVQRSDVSLAYKGRDVDLSRSLTGLGIIGTSRFARERAGAVIVEFVFMLERAAEAKLKVAGHTPTSATPMPLLRPLFASVPEAPAPTAIPKMAFKPALSPAQQKYASQLDQLAGMGFTDQNRLIPLLESKRGNVQAVIQVLFN